VARAGSAGKKKDELTFVSRTADQPGQTINVDLCFVPADHLVAEKLPAVSGSSGRLMISALPGETAKRSSPGQVFADESLDYTEAMLKFVAASRDADGLAPTAASETHAAVNEKSALKAQKQALQQEADELRVARRQQRTQRKVEDNAWEALKPPPLAVPRLDGTPPLADETAPAPTRTAALARQRSLRAQRRAQQKQRRVEDAQWRQRRRQLRERLSALPLVTLWIAILVITDNCTRQCLGLPLFVTGPKVTAELIVAALKVLLPPELQFLISDRGTHFTANAFRILMRDEEFIHVLIARHRPQSNGIAERFVRTLKEWLATQSWQSDAELEILLAQFIAEYNDRPHQGLAMAGLSPNEFAHRCWLF
jgi:transposase InsO family protein